ncbi:MAG: DUF2283 domain-containing protein [Deltaproteobacteria bacterium]|nr:DUF2283 domain-containing protein [Deltaproteobacteria bacterium]
MKITYDTKADAAYIRFMDEEVAAERTTTDIYTQ